MAKFCTNCGKELKEGEVCSCKANGADNIGTALLEIGKGMFTHPVTTIKTYAKEQTFGVALILIGVMSLLTAVFSIALLKGVEDIISSIYSSLIGGLSLGTMDANLPYARTFFTTWIMMVALAFVFAGLLYLVNTVMFKGKANFKTIFSLYGTVSVISSAALILGSILMFIHVGLGILAMALGSMLQMVYLYHGLKTVGPEDENKYGYIYLVTNVFYMLVIFIVCKIFM